jgi:hypothetical protein
LAVYFNFHGELDIGAYGAYVVITSFTMHDVLPYGKQVFCLSQYIILIQLLPVASSLIAVMNMLARRGEIP